MDDTELSATQVERALSILEREQNALVVTKNQERWFRWLRISASVFIITYVVASIVTAIYGPQSLVFNLSGFGVPQVVGILFMVCFSITIITTPLLLIVNAKLALTLIWQRRLVRRTGLSGLQASLWRQHRPTRRFLDYCTAGVAVFGIIFVLLGIIAVVFVLFAKGPPGEALIFAGLFLVLGFTLIAPQLIHRLKQRLGVLADVKRLKQLLEQMKEGGDTAKAASVMVSRRDVEQLSAIESAQINRERAQAISDRNQVGNDYTLLVSRNVHDLRSNLSLEQRLKLEDSLESLLAEPRPPAAHESAETGIWNIRVPETGMKLTYEIDEIRRQVKAVALDAEGANRPATQQGKDNANA